MATWLLIKAPLKNFLLIEVDLDKQMEIVKLVEKIEQRVSSHLYCDTFEIECQIDKLVYKLFKLSDFEITHIEKTLDSTINLSSKK